MRIHFSWIIILFLIMVSCTTTISPSPTATPEIHPTKQPEPDRPLVGGQVSGLPENVEATIYIKTPQNRTVNWGGATVENPWQAVVHKAGGFEYIVTAEAPRYIAQPISYTIHISNNTAYVVRDGQVTGEEAVHLDFRFEPRDSP
jgi:hypothetical protein